MLFRSQQHLAVAGIFFFKHGRFRVGVRPRSAGMDSAHYRKKPGQRQDAARARAAGNRMNPFCSAGMEARGECFRRRFGVRETPSAPGPSFDALEKRPPDIAFRAKVG